jgi:secreted trypsin-like serine protease
MFKLSTQATRLIITLILIFTGCGGSGGSNSSEATSACSLISLGTKVINGQSCAGLNQSPIVRIVLKIEQKYYPICTASMIAADKVLTAAHCFLELPDNLSEIGIISGELGTARYAKAIDLEIAPGLSVSSGRIFNDISILTLEKSAELPTLSLLAGRPIEVGETGYIYGYGVSEIDQAPESVNFSELNSGTMRIENITSNHFFVAYNGNGSNVCFGDSGGPLVVIHNNSPAIIGTTSQGTSKNCASGDITTFINLQNAELLNWILLVSPETQII